MKITDTQKGYVTSLSIHVLLVVVFLLITVDMTPMLSEFADLAFTMEQVKTPEPKRVTRVLDRTHPVVQHNLESSGHLLLKMQETPFFLWIGFDIVEFNRGPAEVRSALSGEERQLPPPLSDDPHIGGVVAG